MAKPLQDHTRIRTEPRISANDLARYMVATDTGKIGIIRRAKEAPAAVVLRYKDARSGLREALRDAVNEKRILAATRDKLEQKARDGSVRPFLRDDAEKSIEVLDAFAGMRNQLAGFDYVAAPKQQPELTLAGVAVSVYCDLLIHRTHKEEEQIGGLLFRLTKAEDDESDRAAEKRRDMGAYAATLVHMHVATNLSGNRKPHHTLCWSVDVQHQELHQAPRTYVSRAQNLENACRFIAAMWNRV
ncbi:MAG: hypothetical protein F9K29_25215 [Hyphomicrobiaceae bacterium]|nr:MAG: hypothetical protein F9K29_25215 [Hyphomicrobiaceae bacterium]